MSTDSISDDSGSEFRQLGIYLYIFVKDIDNREGAINGGGKRAGLAPSR